MIMEITEINSSQDKTYVDSFLKHKLNIEQVYEA